jgi:hypothetical protein
MGYSSPKKLMRPLSLPTLFIAFLLIANSAAAQSHTTDQDTARANRLAAASTPEKIAPPAEDISGMYSFLREGEFVQINLEQSGVSGYISRRGQLESDKGAFLDQFFDKASIQGHDVAFSTKPLHGVVYQFQGRFERGPAKSKSEDGYYIIRGTLNELVTDADNKTTSRSREVAFKLLGQPPESASGREKD